MKSNKKIAVVGLKEGWSSRTLAQALENETGFNCLVDLSQVTCDLARSKAYFNGLELTELDGLAIKKLGPAYSPDLLDRLEMLKFIEAQGVRVFSRPDAIGRVLNRLSCTVALKKAGVPMPPTVITEDPAAAAKAVERLGRCVLKPLFSSKARGMLVVEPRRGLRDALENFKAGGNKIFYIQQMINLPGRDLGLVFLGGRYLATYARVGGKGSWNTTTRSGGRYESHQPSDEIIALAHKAQAAFGLDFTCVDVAESDQGLVVFEVSAFGGFRGLLEGCGLDAAREYAGFMARELDNG
jgi:tetrahydromethanopterin:alpha-L-glutamate ligase